MKNIKAAVLSALLFSVSISAPAEVLIEEKNKAKYLFVVVANGVRYNDAFGNKNHLYTESIWSKLRPLGSICTRLYNRELTYPIPAQASLLTGVWNNYANPRSDSIRPVVPTLFEYWKKNTSDASCYFATSKKYYEVLAHSDSKEYGKDYAPLFETIETGSTDTNALETEEIGSAMYTKAASHIFSSHPSFVYFTSSSGNDDEYKYDAEACKIHDKNVECGEADVLNAYYESIILTDSIVIDLWERIQHDEIYKDKSVFIFLSTHGRHTDDFHGYGDNCRGCQQLNFLIIGPGIKKDFISNKKRNLIDICPTVGTLFNFPTPYAKGKVMKEIVE